MKYLKMFGLSALAAAVLMALVGAGTASATEATCSSGVMCANGAAFEATSGHFVLTGAVEITCEESVVKGSQANTGNSAETVEITLSSLTFTSCLNGWKTTTIKPGRLIIHTDGSDSTGNSGNATITSEGAEITQENGLHCIFTTTAATDVGTLDGSSTTGSTATWTVMGTITRSGGRSGAFCGPSETWEGSYTIQAPDFLDIH